MFVSACCVWVAQLAQLLFVQYHTVNISGWDLAPKRLNLRLLDIGKDPHHRQ